MGTRLEPDREGRKLESPLEEGVKDWDEGGWEQEQDQRLISQCSSSPCCTQALATVFIPTPLLARPIPLHWGRAVTMGLCDVPAAQPHTNFFL